MRIGDAPCIGCEERYLGCHGKCSKYQKFRAERNRELNEKVKRAEAQYYPKLLSKTKRENCRKQRSER